MKLKTNELTTDEAMWLLLAISFLGTFGSANWAATHTLTVKLFEDEFLSETKDRVQIICDKMNATRGKNAPPTRSDNPT